MVSMEESTELWICQFYDETKSHKNKNKVSPVSNFETIFQWFRVSASCTFFDLTVKVFEPFFGQFQKICVQILFHFCKKIARSTFRNLLSRIIFCKVWGKMDKKFNKMGHPRHLFSLFLSLQTQITIFAANKCEKCPSSKQCWDSNPRPLEHTSPPITTRPGLPHKWWLFQTIPKARSFLCYLQ